MTFSILGLKTHIGNLLYRYFFTPKRRLLRSLTFHLHEATVYWHNLTSPTTSLPVRMVIFGQGRTGSTLLEDLICSTEYFQPNGELLNCVEREVLLPVQYVRGLSKLSAPDNFVFHLKVYHLTRDRKRPIDPAAFLTALYRDGWKIIYLKRRNKVRHVLSNIVAEHRGTYHKYSSQEDNISISIDCEDFVERIEERFQFERAEQQALSNIAEYHEVVYEDGLEQQCMHQHTVDNILEYASLEPKRVTTTHYKVNTTPLQDLIRNYNCFLDCIRINNLERFL